MTTKSSKVAARASSGCIEIKSKFDAEFRRFGLSRKALPAFDEFYQLVEQVHRLQSLAFCIWYTDPEGDLLPISNNDNFAKALTTAWPLLRVIIQRKGQYVPDITGYGTAGRRPKIAAKPHPHIAIGLPEDFRRVSAIIDVDVIPETHRRVRLMKNGQDKPLGFYIRDGTSIRVTSHGLEKVPGVFISRLVPGGLAESTGLVAVNDEVLEVNGIEVAGKTLDQVTDMMVANSANLIITVKPVNQRNNISPRRGGSGRSGGSDGGSAGARSAAGSTRSAAGNIGASALVSNPSGARGSQKSNASYHSAQSADSDEVRDHVVEENTLEEEEEVDEDEVEDHTVLETTRGEGDDDEEQEGGHHGGRGGGVNNFGYSDAGHSDSARSFDKKTIVGQ